MVNPELLHQVEELAPYIMPAIGMLGMAYTLAQKEWIRERDSHSCQFPVDYTNTTYTPCGRDRNLQVHHITPQRWSRDVLHRQSDQIDVPENGITLCEEHHQACVHQDIPLAHANYHKDKNSYKKIFEHRNELVTHEKVYWNPTWDNLFKRIAAARNKLMTREFPRK